MDDDDKSIIEKVTDGVKNMVGTASTSGKEAMKPDPKGIAATANEQMFLPEDTVEAAVTAPRLARKRGNAPLHANKRVAVARVTTPKPPSKKAARKSTDRTATKTTAKKAAKKKAALKKAPRSGTRAKSTKR